VVAGLAKVSKWAKAEMVINRRQKFVNPRGL
jgi:hypothetical protein